MTSTISLSQYHRQTGISKSSISHTLNKLNLPTDEGLTPEMVAKLDEEFSSKLALNSDTRGPENLGTVTTSAIVTSDHTFDYVEFSDIEVIDVELSFITSDQTEEELKLQNQLLAVQQQEASISQQLKAERRKSRLAKAAREEIAECQAVEAHRAKVRTNFNINAARAEGLISSPK